MNTIEKKRTASRKAPILGWFAAGLLVLAGLLWFVSSLKSGPTVTGIIRLDGQPLPTGSIKFVPLADTPGPDAGAAISEGKFRIEKGLQVGEYRVEIHGTRKTGKKVQDPVTPGRLVQDEVEVVSPEFNHNSKLIRLINAGANTLDFDVEESKGKGAKPAK